MLLWLKKLLMLTKKSAICIRFFLLSVSMVSSILLQAQSREDIEKNVVIENKKQSFLFKQDKGENPVLIKEQYVTEIKTLKLKSVITYTELYNDHEVIDEVKVKVRNRSIPDDDIEYDYYSIKDVFYSDARICHFKLTLLDDDAPAKITLSKTYKDPRYFTRVFLTEEYVVQYKEIQFIIPRWMKCELKDYNFGENDIKKTTSYNREQDADVYTYIMKDLPAFKSESYDRGIAYNYPHILVLCKESTTTAGKQTYFKTIEDQYKWCYNIVKDNNDDNTRLKARAEEITQAISGDANKVKALLNWVYQNIRYIAYEDGIAAFKPAKATAVMEKKYGDCKGMANLLKGLLKNIGLDARLCWIGTNHIPYDLSTPSLSVHNHMIAAWLYKGKTYFLDGTETNMAFDQYAERIAGREVMIEDGEKFILTKIPGVAAEQNPDTEKRVLAINGQDLQGKAEHTYKGEARSRMINKMWGIKKENLEKAVVNYLSENNQDYQVSNLIKSDFTGTDSVLKMSYDLVHKNGASVFGNEIYVDLDFRKEFGNFTIDTAKRLHNMQLPNKELMNQETELSIPAGYTVATMPANLSLQNSLLEINISFKQNGDKLLYKKQLKIKQTLLKKEEFAVWNGHINQLTEKYKEQVVLSK